MKTSTRFIWLLMIFLISCNNKHDPQPVNDSVYVFPNPTASYFNIRLTNTNQLNYSVQVFGTDGGLIFKEEDNQVNPFYTVYLYDKPKGMYEIVVTKGNIKTRQRVIKI